MHLQTVPGSAFRQDDSDTITGLRQHHLKAYVASGVTTVLDTGISAPTLKEIRSYLANGGAGPRVLALGPVLFSENGYLDGDLVVTSSKPVKNETDILALFDEYQDIADIVGIKVPLEYGFGPWPIWPIHSEQMQETISRIAQQKSRPIYVHATSEQEQTLAIKMGAKVLVHSGYWDESPSDKFLGLTTRQKTYLVSTLAGTLDLHRDRWRRNRLDDPLIQLTVPAVELATLNKAEAWDWSTRKLLGSLKPQWLPDFISDLIASAFMQEEQILAMLNSASRAIKTLHERGVPIVVGTDSGNYPIIINSFHGPSTIRELELLVRAGLSPLAVIKAATATPSDMLETSDQFGTIDAGKQADLLIVSCDPLADISCLRRLDWVIKDGIMKSPAEWMQ